MYKLIVADCSPSVFEAVQASLPEAEFEIHFFSDGTEVIKALDEIRPDAVLLNLSLKAKDGYDVCHFINSQERFFKIPLFFLKGAFEPVDEEKLSGLNFRELIEEPFDSQSLSGKIREVLEGGDEPPILPEEPVLDEQGRFSPGLDRDLRDRMTAELAAFETRIEERLKKMVREDVKKVLEERGPIPLCEKDGSGQED